LAGENPGERAEEGQGEEDTRHANEALLGLRVVDYPNIILAENPYNQRS
jgi:hypothetical protein